MVNCLTGHFIGFAAVIMVVTLVYVILSIVAKMLEIQKLEQVAKAELQEVLIGGFAVILVSYIIFTLSQPIGFAMIQDFITNYGVYTGTTTDPTASGDACPVFFFDTAKTLDNKIALAFTSVFLSVSDASNNASIASSSYLSRGISGSVPTGGSVSQGTGIGSGPVGGSVSASGSLVTFFCKPLNIIPAMLGEVIASCSRIISIMSAQNALLELAKSIYMSMFLIGIILRSINLTRGIGAFFIAFSIALYLYPIFVILTQGYVLEFYKTDMQMDIISPTTGLANAALIGSSMANTAGFTKYEEFAALAALNPKFVYCDEGNVKENLQADMSSYKTQLLNGVNGKTGPNVITMGSLMLSLLLAQGFSLLIVVSLTAGISKIMGGDVGVFIIGQITRIGV